MASQSPTDWYCLLNRVQGAAALPRILDGTLRLASDDTEFQDDRTFCEWTYFIDWEAKEIFVRGSGDEVKVSFEEVSEEWMLRLQHLDRDDEGEGVEAL